jgi:hypothetical protein
MWLQETAIRRDQKKISRLSFWYSADIHYFIACWGCMANLRKEEAVLEFPMFRSVLVVVALGCMLMPSSAEAQEYTCRDRRTGQVLAHPPSRTESQHFENANPRADCFRKGSAVTSSRDEYRQRDRDRYDDRRYRRDRYDDHGYDRRRSRRDDW